MRSSASSHQPGRRRVVVNAGDHYGRYEVIRLIGRGAMGEVYLARDTESQRQIALKIVYKGPEAEDQDVIDAERLGAESQKRLSGADRRVVFVNRYGEINGDLFIEMEYIEGEDLSTILNRGPVRSEERRVGKEGRSRWA